MRAETLAYDHGVVIDAPGSGPGGEGEDHYDDATIGRIRDLPQIESAGGLVTYVAGLANADWEFSLNAPEDNSVGVEIVRERVLRGRIPAPESTDEVAVNESAVDQAHVDVGSVLTVETLTPAQRLQLIAGDPNAFDQGTLGPELKLRVVGVLRGASDVVGRANPAIFASSAFDRMYRGRVAYSSRVLLVRRTGGTTAAEFHDAVDGAISGAAMGVFDAATEDKPARQTTNILSVGLVVFAAVAAVVSAMALNQAVTRHVIGSNPDHVALVALGLTRFQRVRGAIGTVAPAALVGALVAAFGSYVASTLMPVGLAHRIEPDPGIRFDPVVTVSVAVAVVLVVVGAALLAAIPLTRGPRAGHPAVRASSVATALASAGVGPVATTGVRLAFDRRPPALPVRSALLGVSSAIVVLVGALTFTASLDRLETSPHRWGFGWDLMLDTTATGSDSFTEALATDHDLDGVSVLQDNFTLVQRGSEADGVHAYGLGTVVGFVGYALRSGVQPIGPDEVVIGPETARTYHLAIGDTTQVALCPCTGDSATTTMGSVRVVGIALFPEDDDGNFNNALGFSGPGFERHVGESSNSRVAVSIAADRNLEAVAQDLGRRFPGQLSQYSYPSRPGAVESLAGLRPFPRVLAAVASVLGIAALANMLVTTRQRRRRELATLRAIGLTRRQISGCVVWQSLSVTGLALAVGIPIGIVGGAGVWLATTRRSGVATDASRPLASITLWSFAALTTAVAIGIPIGLRTAHANVAKSLHDE
ncbi:MAG TPA: ABC transporter permease [Acidimicrobiales bacterium]|nr:ABC transporter permease [Acidimicrobiales bacterium]